MKDKQFGAWMAAAITGLAISSGAHADKGAVQGTKGKNSGKAKEEPAMYCATSCKGHSECHGHGNTNGCAGQNECKGQGWISARDAKECKSKGGAWKKDEGASKS